MENKYPKIIKSINANDSRIMLAYNRHECVRIDGSRFDRYCGFDFDTSQNWMDTTADYLRNTKIRVESPEHSKMIQKLVFGAGGSWRGFKVDKTVQHRTSEFLFIDDYLFLTCAYLKDINHFTTHNNKEIKLPIPPKEEKQMVKSCSYKVDAILNVPLFHPERKVNKDYDEWPKVGDMVMLSGSCVYEVVINKPDSTGMIVVKDKDDEYVIADLSTCRKPPTPQEKLTNEIYNQIGSKDDSYALAKAILAGEIEGLEYKGD